MPKIGEKMPLELTWREQMGLDPITGPISAKEKRKLETKIKRLKKRKDELEKELGDINGELRNLGVK